MVEDLKREAGAKLAEALALLDAARLDEGHSPAVARDLSVAITHVETGRLWLGQAILRAA